MQHIECLKTGTTHRASPPWHIKALCFPSSRDIAVVDPSLGPDRDPLAGRHAERTSQPMSHPFHSSILRRLTLAGHVQPPSPHHTAASIPLLRANLRRHGHGCHLRPGLGHGRQRHRHRHSSELNSSPEAPMTITQHAKDNQYHPRRGLTRCGTEQLSSPLVWC